MYQNTYVDFKLGYLAAKSDAIAFCVNTYASGSFIKNRTNVHEMHIAQSDEKRILCKSTFTFHLPANKSLFTLNAILVRFVVVRNF